MKANMIKKVSIVEIDENAEEIDPEENELNLM